MTRLEAINNRISPNDIVLDVGCDTALLGGLLAKRGIHSYASDIKENIVKNAYEKACSEKTDKYITFIVSDGLDNVKLEEIDTLVFAGMGTYTILKILDRTDKKFKKIITISNNNHDILRINMNNLGYSIKEEEIIKENGKYYNLIEFKIGNAKYTREEVLLGKNHQNVELLIEKNNYLLTKYKDFYDKSESIKELVDVIKNYKYN